MLNAVPLTESAALHKVDWSPEWHPNLVRIASVNECFNFGTEAWENPRETIQSQMYSCTGRGMSDRILVGSAIYFGLNKQD